MELTIGSRVVLRKSMFGEHEGSIGFVYKQYSFLDSPNEKEVMVIFQGGNYRAFSSGEQNMYLINIDIDPRYSMYIFKSTLQVEKDYRDGHWKFHE